MQKLLALFDRLTEKIPPPAMRMVRLGAVVAWAVAGTTVVFFSWRRGQDATPPEGQDLSRATIRERITRERNREDAGGVTVPDLGEFFPESRAADLPAHQAERPGAGLSGEDDRLIDPENPIEKPGELPPFLGEDSRSEAPLHVPDVRPRRERPSENPGLLKDETPPRTDTRPAPVRERPGPSGRPELLNVE